MQDIRIENGRVIFSLNGMNHDLPLAEFDAFLTRGRFVVTDAEVVAAEKVKKRAP